MEINEIIQTEWDAIIIGTGMGGGAAGYELAKAGKKVLFCEKGKSHLTNKKMIDGAYAEDFFNNKEKKDFTKIDILANSGRWFEKIIDGSNKKPFSYTPFAGCGTGGSSTLYGMIMQRFSPDDFNPKSNFSDAFDSTVPDSWPISYDQLRPYYKEIENLFAVKGEIDPIRSQFLDPIMPRPTIAKEDFSLNLNQYFKKIGLHPYQPPLACDLIKDCNHCQGYICAKNCKNDSTKIFIKPALENHGAYLLDECCVTKLDADKNIVNQVIGIRGGNEIILKGKIIILAAGALETPHLLFNSKSNIWPNGLANSSGHVGKNLMRNFYDLFFIFHNQPNILPDVPKELYLTDFYTTTEQKLGIIQSFGHLSPQAVLEGLETDIENSNFKFLKPLFRLSKPLLFKYIKRKLASAFILVSTMEDLPYKENMVLDNSKEKSKISIQYKVHTYDKNRIELFRKKIKKILKPYKFFMLKQAEQNKNFIALACGTCRMGNDPINSVINAENRAHDITNLYIVDGSFFPTNPGLNSGLTVAANAMRVARNILKRKNIATIKLTAEKKQTKEVQDQTELLTFIR